MKTKNHIDRPLDDVTKLSIYAFYVKCTCDNDAHVPRNIPTKLAAKIFGQIIRARRRALGLTQEALVAASGLDISFISRMERGLTIPSLAALIPLAKGLETSASKLVAELERELNDKKQRGSKS